MFAWEAIDSRGKPTVAVELRLQDGTVGVATAPGGSSTGRYESVERRDGGDRYRGQGVITAVEHVNAEIAAAVSGLHADDQERVDRTLIEVDGERGFRRFGANAAIAVSVATMRAAATQRATPLWEYLARGRPPLLPMPVVNVLSGGARATDGCDFQDILVIPVGAGSFAQAVEWAEAIRRAAAEVASERGYLNKLIAGEGRVLPTVDNERAMKLLVECIERCGLVAGHEIAISVDVAASQLRDVDGNYVLRSQEQLLSAAGLVEFLSDLARRYPIVQIEDVLGEDDWEAWSAATPRPKPCQVVGDDLFATDADRIRKGVRLGCGNAVLLKPNQSGTVTLAKAAFDAASAAGYDTIVSDRSGDTHEDWLADIAVGWRASQIKIGSTARAERTAKINRLLRLEAEYGSESWSGCPPGLRRTLRADG